MRVVAGEARGRTLAAPPGRGVRPTTDRVREAVFNALGSLGAVDGAVVVDLFAGTGALGIEALSRGASRAVFVDPSRSARQAVEFNLDLTGLAGRASVVAARAERFLAGAARRGQVFDLVLCDPPYAFDGWVELLDLVEPVIGAHGVLVAESGAEVAAPPWGSMTRARRYSSTVVTMITRITAPPAPEA